MKFTFLRPWKIGYIENWETLISEGIPWDYFFATDKDEVTRLKWLKQIGYPMLSYEEVKKEVVEKEVEEEKSKLKKKVEAEKEMEEANLDTLYEEKFGKEVPKNKKNDDDWKKKKLLED